MKHKESLRLFCLLGQSVIVESNKEWIKKIKFTQYTVTFLVKCFFNLIQL